MYDIEEEEFCQLTADNRRHSVTEVCNANYYYTIIDLSCLLIIARTFQHCSILPHGTVLKQTL